MDQLISGATRASQPANLTVINGTEVVADYGDPAAEYTALTERAGVLDASFRGRLCLLGADRVRFLHGQVTNDVNSLRQGEGCYAALITAKGKMQSDLNIYALSDELLLDFEPGLTDTLIKRLEHYIIADDVQVVDASPAYGLLTVQGPASAEVVRSLNFAAVSPDKPFGFVQVSEGGLGEIYVVNRPRLATQGFDLFVPTAAVAEVERQLREAAEKAGGCHCGWQAFEWARVNAGIPRFGADMDETNIPLEAELESAISFRKGCYIGQEVISRICTYGQVAKALRKLRFAEGLGEIPSKGDRLFLAGKEVGYVTSAVRLPGLTSPLGLGYVRKESNAIGTELTLRGSASESIATIVGLPGK